MEEECNMLISGFGRLMNHGVMAVFAGNDNISVGMELSGPISLSKNNIL